MIPAGTKVDASRPRLCPPPELLLDCGEGLAMNLSGGLPPQAISIANLATLPLLSSLTFAGHSHTTSPPCLPPRRTRTRAHHRSSTIQLSFVPHAHAVSHRSASSFPPPCSVVVCRLSSGPAGCAAPGARPGGRAPGHSRSSPCPLPPRTRNLLLQRLVVPPAAQRGDVLAQLLGLLAVQRQGRGEAADVPAAAAHSRSSLNPAHML